MSSPHAAAVNVSGGLVFTGMQDFDSLVELSRSRNGSVCAPRRPPTAFPAFFNAGFQLQGAA